MKSLFAKTAIISALLLLIVCWSAGISFYLCAWVETICYAILTIFLLKRYSQNENKKFFVITSGIMFGFVLLQLPVRIFNYSSCDISMLVMINTLIAIICTALCYYKKKVYLYVVSAMIIVLLNTIIHEAWLDSFNPCK